MAKRAAPARKGAGKKRKEAEEEVPAAEEAAPAEEPAAAEAEAEPQRQVRRRVAPAEREALQPIEHASHGKVRWTRTCFAQSMFRRTVWSGSTRPSPTQTLVHPNAQIAGEVFLFGDGDCGQLGMGEEVTERLRPFPLSIDGGKKVCTGPRFVRGLTGAFLFHHSERTPSSCWICRLCVGSSHRCKGHQAGSLCHCHVTHLCVALFTFILYFCFCYSRCCKSPAAACTPWRC